MIDDRAVEAARQALAHCERNPRLIDCPRCKGAGYHHGFGENGWDPDWCDECGGGKYIVDPNHAAEAALSAAAPFLTQIPDGRSVEIAHDGFAGTVQGSYVTREGKRGVVVQQHGTRVVHVYGEKWLAPPTEKNDG